MPSTPRRQARLPRKTVCADLRRGKKAPGRCERLGMGFGRLAMPKTAGLKLLDESINLLGEEIGPSRPGWSTSSRLLRGSYTHHYLHPAPRFQRRLYLSGQTRHVRGGPWAFLNTSVSQAAKRSGGRIARAGRPFLTRLRRCLMTWGRSSMPAWGFLPDLAEGSHDYRHATSAISLSEPP